MFYGHNSSGKRGTNDKGDIFNKKRFIGRGTPKFGCALFFPRPEVRA